jgi:hypothetical protein
MSQTLANVKFSSILPLGKTSNYVEREKLQFSIPSRYMYLDGKQSYLYLEVDNTSVFTGTAISCPVVYQPHVGVSALAERIQLQDLPTSHDLEDIDGYNTMVGIMNSYGNDTDTFDQMGKVEQVTAHNPRPEHRSISKPYNQYFVGSVDDTTISDEINSSNVAMTASSCMPIHLGLWSNFEQDEHKVYPNGLIGGSRLNIYLEQAKVALCEPGNEFKVVEADGSLSTNGKNITELVDLEATTAADVVITVVTGECSMANTNPSNISYRIGMPINVYTDAGATLDVATTIKSVQTSGANLVLGLADAIVTGGVTPSFKVDDITFGFSIKKAELRVLETTPLNVNEIAKSMASGINYKTVQLNKLSSPASLINTILDLPAVVDRGNSILVAPCASNGLDSSNESNTRLYPQQEDNNTYNYQYQIKNYLIPNRSVLINKNLNTQSDNTIFYQQLTMAMRTFMETRCLNDGLSPGLPELANPLVIPLQLAPTNTSFRLVDSEPQLRITNGTSGNTLAKLFYVFTIHTRKLISSPDGISVEL